MVNSATVRLAAAVILIVSSSIYSCIVMFMETRPTLPEPYALSRAMAMDRHFASVREELPPDGFIGYHFGSTFNKAAVRKLIASDAFKKAYLDRLETGKPMDEKVVDLDAFRILEGKEARLYNKFILAQFALAPRVLVTKSFEYFEDIVVYSERFRWDLEEYPDLLLVDLRGFGRGRKIEIPEKFKVSRDFKNGLILFEREN
jgi:hypothetical protein